MGNKLNCLSNNAERPPPKGLPIEGPTPGEQKQQTNPVAAGGESVGEEEKEAPKEPKGADASARTAPSNIKLLVCDNFRIDITADEFGLCVCGHEKAAHSFPADGEVCKPTEDK